MGATSALAYMEIAGAAVSAGTAIYSATRSGPKPPKPPLMVDQAQLTQGQQLEAEQAAAMRQGRASTILTSNANTGDKLGP